MSDERRENDLAESIDLLFTMVEGLMQAQEYVVMSLLQEGSLDREALKRRVEAALAREDIRMGTSFPLSRLMDILRDRPPQPPRWTPRLIEGRNKPGQTPG